MLGGPRWRVFVSHTSDLASFPRGSSFVAAAVAAIRNAGHVPVDMADFPAGPDEPAEFCRKQVSSCDVFIAIIGFSYGSPVRNQPRMSYVEFELRVAEELSLPKLVFVLREDAHRIGKFLRSRRYADRQRAFRAHILESGPTVRKISTTHDLEIEVFKALIALSGRQPGPSDGGSRLGRLFAVPPLSGQEVARPEIMDRLVSHLHARSSESTSIVLTTGLEGAGGFGKTTLATLACHDPRLRELFTSGIVWLTLGQSVRGGVLAERINQLAMQLARAMQLPGEQPSFTDTEPAGQYLGRLLDEGRWLLVADDVWFPDQLAPLMIGGAGCTRLITTRVRSLLEGSPAIVVDQMNRQQASEMLSRGLPPGTEVSGLLNRTGGWPVLLKLVNRAVRRQLRYSSPETEPGRAATAAVRRIETDLASGGPAAVDVALSSRREDAVTTVVAASLRLLADSDPAWLDRYRELAVFADDVDVPLAVLERYWRMSPRAVERLCLELAELSLVQRLVLEDDRRVLRLHDVICEHLRQLAGERVLTQHRQLLDSYQGLLPEAGAWWSLPAEHDYMWRNLGRHLRAAGEGSDLTALLHDLRWAVGKIATVGAAELEADILLLDDEQSVALARLVRQTGHLYVPGTPPSMVAATLHAFAAGVPVLAEQASMLKARVDPPFLRPTAPPFPDQPDPSVLRTLIGYPEGDDVLSTAPDSSWLASAGRDGVIRVWDVSAGVQRAELVGHHGLVTALAVAPDGAWLASAGDDGTVHVWDTSAYRKQNTFTGHPGGVTALAAGPDGSWLASAGRDGVIRVWDVSAGVQRAELVGHLGPVTTLAAALDGSWLASGGADGTVRMWNPVAGAKRTDFEQVALADQNDGVAVLVVAPSGAWLAGASKGGTLQVWEASTGRRLSSSHAHRGGVSSLATAPDGRWLASAGADGVVRTWDPNTGVRKAVLEGHTSRINALAVATDGAWLASAGDDGAVRIWNPVTGQAIAVLAGHTNRVNALAVASDGRWLASAGGDPIQRAAAIRIWEPASARSVRPANQATDLYNIVQAPDGTWLAAASHDGRVHIWESASGVLRTVVTGHAPGIHRLTVAPDGSWFAGVGSFGTVRLWDPTDGSQRAVFVGHIGDVHHLLADPKGRWLASAGGDHTVRLWNTTRDSGHTTLGSHPGSVEVLVASPDGSWLASAGANGTVLTWDTAGGQRARMVGHTAAVNVLAVAPDGSWLASAGLDETVRLWNPSDGTARAVLTGHTDEIQQLLVAPDGSWLASAGGDSTVRLWNPSNDAEQVVLDGHSEGVHRLFAAPDGSWLASASLEGTVRVWNPSTGTELGVLRHPGGIYPTGVAAHHSRIATAGRDGTIWVWEPSGTQPPTGIRVDAPLSSCAWCLSGRRLAAGGSRGLYLMDVET